MSKRYRFSQEYGLYFITLTVVGWVDVFTRQIYRDILLESWTFCRDQKGLYIHAYVIMSNHVHMVVSVKEGEQLANVIGAMKSYTAKAILQSIRKGKESRRDWLLNVFKAYARRNKADRNKQIHQFWQADSHPIALYSKHFTVQKINYIHLNPVRAGLVELPQDYLYSSASNYFLQGKGLITVDLLEVFFEPKG